MRVTCPVKLTREAITLMDGRQLLPASVGFRSLFRTNAHKPYRLRISKNATRSSLALYHEDGCFHYFVQRPTTNPPTYKRLRLRNGRIARFMIRKRVMVVIVATDYFRQLIAPLNPNKRIYITLENMP